MKVILRFIFTEGELNLLLYRKQEFIVQSTPRICLSTENSPTSTKKSTDPTTYKNINFPQPIVVYEKDADDSTNTV